MDQVPSSTLFQCNNWPECGMVFAHPDILVLGGRSLRACPECYDPEITALPKVVIWSLYWHIIAHDFTLSERDFWRGIAEASMEPYNPLQRDI